MDIEEVFQRLLANSSDYKYGIGETRFTNEIGETYAWRRYVINGDSKFVCCRCHTNNYKKRFDLLQAEFSDKVEYVEYNGVYRPNCQVLGCRGFAQNMGTSGKVYKKHRLDYCENVDGRLGFYCTTTITSPDVLDVDHIDEGHDNNSPENCQTLCKCCHAEKNGMVRRRQLDKIRFMLTVIKLQREQYREAA